MEKKTHKIKFSSWKTVSRKLDLSRALVSMDVEKEMVTVKFLKK